MKECQEVYEAPEIEEIATTLFAGAEPVGSPVVPDPGDSSLWD